MSEDKLYIFDRDQIAIDGMTGEELVIVTRPGAHYVADPEPVAWRRDEIAKLVASLKAEFGKLIHPCWEGVGAHREDDMERLFELLEEEFINGDQSAKAEGGKE